MIEVVLNIVLLPHTGYLLRIASFLPEVASIQSTFRFEIKGFSAFQAKSFVFSEKISISLTDQKPCLIAREGDKR